MVSTQTRFGVSFSVSEENRLTNELFDYEPEVLFSYPEPKELQEGLLKVL